ncbi:MAG: Trm112 family protein [Rudaea sp.]
MDKRLLDILCCPVNKTPVKLLSRAQLDAINREIVQAGVKTVAGTAVGAELKAGLITTDGKVIYRIDEDIPVMLADEGIGTTQFNAFPA